MTGRELGVLAAVLAVISLILLGPNALLLYYKCRRDFSRLLMYWSVRKLFLLIVQSLKAQPTSRSINFKTGSVKVEFLLSGEAFSLERNSDGVMRLHGNTATPAGRRVADMCKRTNIVVL